VKEVLMSWFLLSLFILLVAVPFLLGYRAVARWR